MCWVQYWLQEEVVIVWLLVSNIIMKLFSKIYRKIQTKFTSLKLHYRIQIQPTQLKSSLTLRPDIGHQLYPYTDNTSLRTSLLPFIMYQFGSALTLIWSQSVNWHNICTYTLVILSFSPPFVFCNTLSTSSRSLNWSCPLESVHLRNVSQSQILWRQAGLTSQGWSQ